MYFMPKCGHILIVILKLSLLDYIIAIISCVKVFGYPIKVAIIMIGLIQSSWQLYYSTFVDINLPKKFNKHRNQLSVRVGVGRGDGKQQ